MTYSLKKKHATESSSSSSSSSKQSRNRFFGRDEELAQFMSCFENALNGTGSFVLVTGKEGIGKSTILSEAGNRLRDRGALVLEGRCRPGLLSYHALLPVARRALDLLCKENISDDLLIPAVNLLEVLEGRAAPVTSIQDPATHRINLFDQMATLLRAASEIRPLVVLVHDIDFADPGTLHLISYLGRVLTGLPELSGGQFRGMLVTNAQRSSAISMDPRWENSVNLVRMSLDGLTAGGVREFLASEEVVSQVDQR